MSVTEKRDEPSATPPRADAAQSVERRYYKALQRFPSRNPLDWLEVERAIEREAASLQLEAADAR